PVGRLRNAHAGLLRRRFPRYLRREDAVRAGLIQRALHAYARVSFAKVAEYQKRGAVHSHAVIRSDGPEGGDTPPPAWAATALLTDAIRAATARVDGPVVDGRVQT
ncbi:replication initiation protein, partial [Streptomyces sp. TRM76130]|nr:replication initiation protein [Streptomyces sp. TRM76130]